jgi:hypothetical protein
MSNLIVIIMMLLTRTSQVSRSLLRLGYNFSYWDWEQFPKPWNLKNTKAEKKMLYDKKNRPFGPYVTDLNDPLYIAGLEGNKLLTLYQDFLEHLNEPLSPQNVAMMIYNFAKSNYLTPRIWPALEANISRSRGEFEVRSIFGCLYGVILSGKPEYIQFFVEEMKGHALSYTDMEAIEIIEAFNKSSYPYTQEFKFEFWDTFFKPHYVANITSEVKIHKFSDAIRIFDAFNKF